MKDPIVDSEILHGNEGGDVERWLEPQNISLCLISLSLNSLLFISRIVIIAHIYTCLILFVCSYLCLTKRAIEPPQLLV